MVIRWGMVEYLVIGGSFAFAAAVQPGPLQAFLVSRVASTSWRRTLPACLAPLISDVPIALLVLLVLDQLSVNTQHVLRASGGVLLLYFAFVALRQIQRPGSIDLRHSAPRTLLDAVLVNLLNPNPYIGWSLVLGPSVLAAWREQPMYGVAVVGSFYLHNGSDAGAVYLFGRYCSLLGFEWPTRSHCGFRCCFSGPRVVFHVRRRTRIDEGGITSVCA